MTQTANTRELRKTRPGWQVVHYIDCDVRAGKPVRATAEKIVKDWYPTRREAEAHLGGT